MNKTELSVEMLRFGDNQTNLADYLEIKVQTVCNKINGHAEFTQSEIKAIQERYNLSPERLAEIFFA